MMVSQRPRRTREVTGPTPASVAIRAKNPYKRPPDWRTLERRDQEERLQKIQSLTSHVAMSDMRNEWEKFTDKKIKLNTIKRHIDSERVLMQHSLEDRREKLRKLLCMEDALYMEESESLQETMLERQAKMRERARSMKERREAERLELVQEKYDQQFREQCEELRSTISKRTQDQVCLERLEQLRLKDQIAVEKDMEERMWADLWEKDRLKKAEREEEEARIAHARNQEMVGVLQKQMAAMEEKKKEEERLKKEECELLREQQTLRNWEEMQKQMDKENKQKEMRDMLDQSMKIKMRKKAREEQEQLAFDLKMLEQLLEESRNEAMETMQRKKELREEDRRYREYLKRMMEEEKCKEKLLDKMIAEEVERSWQKRLDQWKREREARRKLLADVLVGRAEQVREKLVQNEIRQLEAQRERAELAKQIQENQKMEAEKAAKLHARNKQYQADLLDQARYNEEKRQRDLERDQQELELMRLAEAQYQEKMRRVLSDPTLCTKMHPMRRRLVEGAGDSF